MTKTIKGFFLHFFKINFLVTALCCLIQYLVVESYLQRELFYPTLVTYLFLFLLSLGIYALVLLVYKNLPEKTGFAYMGLSVFKMLLALFYLLPLLLSDSSKSDLLIDIMSFFIPYFLYLILETIFAVKLLLNK